MFSPEVTEGIEVPFVVPSTTILGILVSPTGDLVRCPLGRVCSSTSTNSDEFRLYVDGRDHLHLQGSLPPPVLLRLTTGSLCGEDTSDGYLTLVVGVFPDRTSSRAGPVEGGWCVVR